jgi:hypothetical protein
VRQGQAAEPEVPEPPEPVLDEELPDEDDVLLDEDDEPASPLEPLDAADDESPEAAGTVEDEPERLSVR